MFAVPRRHRIDSEVYDRTLLPLAPNSQLGHRVYLCRSPGKKEPTETKHPHIHEVLNHVKKLDGDWCFWDLPFRSESLVARVGKEVRNQVLPYRVSEMGVLPIQIIFSFTSSILWWLTLDSKNIAIITVMEENDSHSCMLYSLLGMLDVVPPGTGFSATGSLGTGPLEVSPTVLPNFEDWCNSLTERMTKTFLSYERRPQAAASHSWSPPLEGSRCILDPSIAPPSVWGPGRLRYLSYIHSLLSQPGMTVVPQPTMRLKCIMVENFVGSAAGLVVEMFHINSSRLVDGKMVTGSRSGKSKKWKNVTTDRGVPDRGGVGTDRSGAERGGNDGSPRQSEDRRTLGGGPGPLDHQSSSQAEWESVWWQCIGQFRKHRKSHHLKTVFGWNGCPQKQDGEKVSAPSDLSISILPTATSTNAQLVESRDTSLGCSRTWNFSAEELALCGDVIIVLRQTLPVAETPLTTWANGHSAQYTAKHDEEKLFYPCALFHFNTAFVDHESIHLQKEHFEYYHLGARNNKVLTLLGVENPNFRCSLILHEIVPAPTQRPDVPFSDFVDHGGGAALDGGGASLDGSSGLGSGPGRGGSLVELPSASRRQSFNANDRFVPATVPRLDFSDLRQDLRHDPRHDLRQDADDLQSDFHSDLQSEMQSEKLVGEEALTPVDKERISQRHSEALEESQLRGTRSALTSRKNRGFGRALQKMVPSTSRGKRFLGIPVTARRGSRSVVESVEVAEASASVGLVSLTFWLEVCLLKTQTRFLPTRPWADLEEFNARHCVVPDHRNIEEWWCPESGCDLRRAVFCTKVCDNTIAAQDVADKYFAVDSSSRVNSSSNPRKKPHTFLTKLKFHVIEFLQDTTSSTIPTQLSHRRSESCDNKHDYDEDDSQRLSPHHHSPPGRLQSCRDKHTTTLHQFPTSPDLTHLVGLTSDPLGIDPLGIDPLGIDPLGTDNLGSDSLGPHSLGPDPLSRPFGASGLGSSGRATVTEPAALLRHDPAERGAHLTAPLAQQLYQAPAMHRDAAPFTASSGDLELAPFARDTIGGLVGGATGDPMMGSVPDPAARRQSVAVDHQDHKRANRFKTTEVRAIFVTRDLGGSTRQLKPCRSVEALSPTPHDRHGTVGDRIVGDPAAETKRRVAALDQEMSTEACSDLGGSSETARRSPAPMPSLPVDLKAALAGGLRNLKKPSPAPPTVVKTKSEGTGGGTLDEGSGGGKSEGGGKTPRGGAKTVRGGKVDGGGAGDKTATRNSIDVAGPREAGLREAGSRAAGLREAGLREAGLREAGLREAGLREAGPRDSVSSSATAISVESAVVESQQRLLPAGVKEGLISRSSAPPTPNADVKPKPAKKKAPPPKMGGLAALLAKRQETSGKAVPAALPAKKAPLGRKLFWKPLENADLSETVFGDLSSTNAICGSNIFEPSRLDMISKVFAKDSAKKAAMKKTASDQDASEDKKLVRIIDDRRAQNVGIVVLRMKISPIELAQQLMGMQLSVDLTLEMLQKVEWLFFNDDEETELEQYLAKNPNAELLRDVPEKRLLPLRKSLLPRGHQRTVILQQKLRWPGWVRDLTENLDLIKRASDEMRSCVCFRAMLSAVLRWGNFVNYGSSELHIKAITLSSLLKLTEFKTTVDAKITSLHYLVATLLASTDKVEDAISLARMTQEMKTVRQASKVTSEVIEMIWKQLNNANDMVKKELETQAQHYETKNGVDRGFNTLQEISMRMVADLARLEIYASETMRLVQGTAKFFGDDDAVDQNAGGASKFHVGSVFATLDMFLRRFDECVTDIVRRTALYASILSDDQTPQLISFVTTFTGRPLPRNTVMALEARKELNRVNQERTKSSQTELT
ncbi:formin-like 2 domain protein [Gregarina niphandrodes]|uniref:Formin-like 2 domain protein n=1 Tax=Gregarina niphandrodes TaxID=110365 RepID=A0A023B7G2_GRENI|nr:formin-like 2 domain protein [Gregarina niphandrodes]EZG67249.1 formin-like 2 domain protein [Gregarina niphandrodes]|eukprot:XP_011130294.1 formin-like 2 domain protein [Gregarina niphandrodes]